MQRPGVRGDQTGPTPSGEFVIGDSFTMGSGVEIEKVYHSVVEEKLNEREDSVRYELINFGVGGYNLLNYSGVLEKKAVLYDPDFIVIGFCGQQRFHDAQRKALRRKFTG